MWSERGNIPLQRWEKDELHPDFGGFPSGDVLLICQCWTQKLPAASEMQFAVMDELEVQAQSFFSKDLDKTARV